MSLADPAAITINGAEFDLVRISQDGYSAEYRLKGTTGEHRLLVRNSTYTDKKSGVSRDRHNIDLTEVVYSTGPNVPDITRHCYVVFENQKGDALTDVTHVVLGLLAFLSASSGANVAKMLNFES